MTTKKTTRPKKSKIGSSFESFLKDEGVLEETTARAIKRVIAFQLVSAMKKKRLTKNALAKRMSTSRSQLDRILDPNNEGVSLQALANAAKAVGRQLHLELR